MGDGEGIRRNADTLKSRRSEMEDGRLEIRSPDSRPSASSICNLLTIYLPSSIFSCLRVNTIFKGLRIRIIEGWEEAEEAEDWRMGREGMQDSIWGGK